MTACVKSREFDFVSAARAQLTPERGNALIEVSQLSVSYDLRHEQPRHALYSVGFRIAAGERVGVLGESGSGKSTLALTLMGLLPRNARVTKGSVKFRGIDLLHLREDELQKVGGPLSRRGFFLLVLVCDFLIRQKGAAR